MIVNMTNLLFLLVIFCANLLSTHSTSFGNPNGITKYALNDPIAEQNKRAYPNRCPICDSSVCSYCTDKLLHDSCCCSSNYFNPYEIPYECKFADCSFLHANTCGEHEMISTCCCNRHTCF